MENRDCIAESDNSDFVEAALWSLLQADAFEAAILTAADPADALRHDCGHVARAYYGEFGIPQQWLDRSDVLGTAL